MKKKIVIGMAAMLVLLGWSAPTEATLIEIGLTAKVWQVDDRANLLEGKIQVDDIITGVYRYDSETVDSNPESDVGSYWHYSAPYGIELHCGELTFKTDPINVDFYINIGNNWGTTKEDFYVVHSRNNLPLTSGIDIDEIGWQIDDPTGKAITSTFLPNIPPDLDKWKSTFGLEIRSEKIYPELENFSIFCNVESVTLIPEPLTISLLVFGLVGVIRKSKC